MLASLKVTVLVVAASEACAPVQVVAAAGALAMVKPEGSVVVKFDCVSAKPFVFSNVNVSVAAALGATLLGANAALIVGATGVGSSAVGHAVSPPEVGALLMALP